MKNDRRYGLVPAAVPLLLSFRCDRLPGLDADIPGRIYVNSFECAPDTAGWRGFAGIRIVRDAPPGGGFLAAHAAGGDACF